jgi:hypothetical protein
VLESIKNLFVPEVPAALALAQKKRRLQWILQHNGLSRTHALGIVSDYFNESLAISKEYSHNLPVTVEREVQSSSSFKPVPGALAGSRTGGNTRNTNSRK